MSQNIFVVGLDDSNRALLEGLPDAENFTFHQLLTFDELQAGPVSVPDLLDKSQRQLDAFEGSIDAIMGFLDFPANLMVPILCQRYGLTAADLKAVLKCEHKYWSRLEQQKVIEEYPAFGLIDIDDDEVTLPAHVSYPAWIKPVLSHSSQGAFYLENDEQLRASLEQERRDVDRLGGPFEDVLAMLELPEEIAAAGGRAAMVEESATGDQFTVEGFSHDGEIQIYGVVDSVTYEGAPSFLRYQYPSGLPTAKKELMEDVSRRVISQVGLTNTTFNIEYFWDRSSDTLRLLEVNARHSQSHATLFAEVDGVSNHACMVSLALNEKPKFRQNQGPAGSAAKWFLRRFTDGVVQRIPTEAEVAEIQQQIPGTTIEVSATEGSRLSDAYNEDGYSYVLAEIFTTGEDEAELIDKYQRCVDTLNFEIEDRVEGA